MTFLSTMWPRNLTLLWKKSHFSVLSVTPAFLILAKEPFILWSCSSRVLPCMRTSLTMQTTPSRLDWIPTFHLKVLRHWDYPEWEAVETESPKGGDVGVRSADSFQSSIYQKPEFASKFVKTLAPSSWARVWSINGRMCLSLQALLFNLMRSTQMQTLWSCFGTTTIPAHQSVSSSTLEMTPSCSITVLAAGKGYSPWLIGLISVIQWLGVSTRTFVGCSPQINPHWMCRIYVGECQWVAHRYLEVDSWDPFRISSWQVSCRCYQRWHWIQHRYNLEFHRRTIDGEGHDPWIVSCIDSEYLPIYGGNEHIIMISWNQPDGLDWTVHNLVEALLPTLAASGFACWALWTSIGAWFPSSRASLLSRGLLMPLLSRKVSVLLLGSLSFVLWLLLAAMDVVDICSLALCSSATAAWPTVHLAKLTSSCIVRLCPPRSLQQSESNL